MNTKIDRRYRLDELSDKAQVCALACRRSLSVAANERGWNPWWLTPCVKFSAGALGLDAAVTGFRQAGRGALQRTLRAAEGFCLTAKRRADTLINQVRFTVDAVTGAPDWSAVRTHPAAAVGWRPEDRIRIEQAVDFHPLCSILCAWLTEMFNSAYALAFARLYLPDSAAVYNAAGEPVYAEDEGNFLPAQKHVMPAKEYAE